MVKNANPSYNGSNIATWSEYFHVLADMVEHLCHSKVGAANPAGSSKIARPYQDLTSRSLHSECQLGDLLMGEGQGNPKYTV